MSVPPTRNLFADAAQYFAYEAFSYSGAKELLLSAQHYTDWRASEFDSAAYRIGRAVHTLVLEGADAFAESFAIPPPFFLTRDGRESRSWKTSEAQEWRERMQSNGLTCLSRAELSEIHATARAVVEHPIARELLAMRTHTELSVVWTDDEFDVPCKCRFDAVAEADRLSFGLDLKTVRRGGASESAFMRQAAKFSYGLQWCHYDAGWQALTGAPLAGWFAIVVEKERPYGVQVFEFDESWWTRALMPRTLALATYANWCNDGRPTDGPAYPLEITKLECPAWA